MTLDQINKAAPQTVKEEFLRCCGSNRWAEAMTARRPFKNKEELFRRSGEIWNTLSRGDWLEAFSHHPKIGDIGSLRTRFAGTKEWAEGEQSGVNSAPDEILTGLVEGNRSYEQKFGYIFIVCATGKSADEMLAILQGRMKNDATAEIKIAAAEQNKITHIRLEKLLR